MGAPQSLLDTLQYGFTISLREEPVLSTPNLKWATILEQEAMAVARDKVSQLAMKGAVEVVPWIQAVFQTVLHTQEDIRRLQSHY